MASHQPESEWLTRKTRIDPKLDEAGWVLPKSGTKPLHAAHRTEEEETTNGLADYALWLDNKVIGVIEAKKVTLGPQGVLKQAERYAKGLHRGSYALPPPYSTCVNTRSVPSK